MMENFFFLANRTVESNHTWAQLEPPTLFICHGGVPYRGFELSSILLFLTGALLFLLSVAVVLKRWRHYVAVRRHRLLTIQASSRSVSPGTLRTIIVRGDARNKYASRTSGVAPPSWKPDQDNLAASQIPSAGLEFMPAYKLPPYAEYPPPPYEDPERHAPCFSEV